MKKILEKGLVLIILIAMFFIASCTGVTETGNPYQTPEPPQSMPADDGGDEAGEEAEPAGMPAESGRYVNYEYGVIVKYSEKWIVETSAENLSSVTFYDENDPTTMATISFKRLGEEPDSLGGYLSDTYADLTFRIYDTETLGGYVYNYSDEGENGGDRKMYFFLDGDVLVKVDAEIFPEGAAGLVELLNGISFQ